MADYTVATNLISWLVLDRGWFGWPEDSAVADRVAEMEIGDEIVPKFAQAASYDAQPGHSDYQQRVAEAFEVDYVRLLAGYSEKVQGGVGAVPLVMRVTGPRFRRTGDETPAGVPWSFVPVKVDWLEYPISTSEFLRLRVVPISVGVQFKATVARGRHVQRLPDGAITEIKRIGRSPDRSTKDLRTESLVRASSVDDAVQTLNSAGLPPRRLDRAFVADEHRMIGLCTCTTDGTLEVSGESIERPVFWLRGLFLHAKQVSGKFTAQRALHAAHDLEELVDGADPVRVIDEFGQFHDRFVLLPRKVTDALDLADLASPDALPPSPIETVEDEPDDEPANVEELALEQVQGLTVSAVRKALPTGMAIDDDVLAETVTALRAGKHLIFSGPPGTGKSTLATAVCDAVSADRRTATATADWSTVDTIGAYLPHSEGGLRFEEGLVLGALAAGEWLVIDEMNRADIDKAFGPLFTLLAGAGGSGSDTVTLPFRRDDRRVEIGWSPTRLESEHDYTVTPAWRLIGTMNDRDRASLFGMSFAFLRRFAVIDVSLPDDATYRDLLLRRLPSDPHHDPEQLLSAAMAIAHGPIPLGPAILLDIAEFTRRGTRATAAGVPPYATAAAAFLTAARLYAAPQYEGAESAQTDRLRTRLNEVFENPPPRAWQRLDEALRRAAIDGQ